MHRRPVTDNTAPYQREVYAPSQGVYAPPLVPEIAMLGRSRWDRTQIHGLLPHQHETYEFCYLADGAVTWAVEEECFDLGRGDLFFTRPGELHGGRDAMMHPCDLYWVQVHIRADSALPGLSNEETLTLSEGLIPEGGPRQFAASPITAEAFYRLLVEHRQGIERFSKTMARATLHTLLVNIVRDRAAAIRPRMIAPSSLIVSALAWMTERLGEPFCIQDAAATIGLHPSRFHERFLMEMGQTPSEWRIRQRVSRAQQLLIAPDASITQVAFSLGFTTSQYFATAFKRYTGYTPTEYRRQYATDERIPGHNRGGVADTDVAL